MWSMTTAPSGSSGMSTGSRTSPMGNAIAFNTYM
jgi:hypothetical protein